GELDVDPLSGRERPGGAEDLLARAHDRVAAGKRRSWREGAQVRTRPFERGAAALDEEERRPVETVAGVVQALRMALEHAARSALEAGVAAGKPFEELIQIGDDEAGCRARGRRAD